MQVEGEWPGARQKERQYSKADTKRRDDSVFTSLKLHPGQIVKNGTIPTESQYKQQPVPPFFFAHFRVTVKRNAYSEASEHRAFVEIRINKYKTPGMPRKVQFQKCSFNGRTPA